MCETVVKRQMHIFFTVSRDIETTRLTSAGQSVMRQLQGRRSMTRRRSRLQTVRLRRLKKSVEGFGHFVRQFLIFGFALEAQIVACAFYREQFCPGRNQLQR